MKKIKSLIVGILLVLSVLAVINPVSAATLEVGPGKTYASIGAAMADAGNGDTILVYPGTYNENVLINKSNITLKSVAGRDSTIVGPGTGANQNTVISIQAGLGTITVDGFTVLLSSDKLSGYHPIGIGQRMAAGAGTASHIFNNKIKVTGTLRNGIQVSGDNSKIIGNIVEGGPLTADWGSSGILIATTGTAKNILIKDNHLLGEMDYGIGIITWGSGGEVSDTIVEGNIVEKTVYAGISIGGKVSNTLVKDNIIKNNPANGLEEIHTNYYGYAAGNPTGTKVWYNQFCNNGKDIDIYDDPNDSYVIGEPKLDARGNTGCRSNTLPMKRILGILNKNSDKN
ncbi:MAG: hypothetical protein APG12_00052 [Candidatus Methanofastidiosum methylothiophilum]|uniref:Right handed beta helix domain-containing protein n=1 Tax=Candidatus Methanofastidiosum methylothiophilum TaxID=1705564 RepID=A0A150J2D6_9EURY|nr:MAG: hypothetical protein APG10_00212 [Candidatus Methanofastidiosum methylthiophilus]KYC48742.1 MAG: hypothetical protein APG11_00053 [Candidatus Methanofastidiosum methylthiophilus]KYC51390.1 MAG: hypothetical protein APG12_00052 [Candidatus Methanofastidiosum methylthiophilus]